MLSLINWEALLLLLVLVIIDYVTGLVGAAMNGELESSKMRQGLLHKASYFVVLFFAVVVTYLASYVDLGIDLSAGIVAVIVWIALTECVSIVENLVVINPQLENNPFFALFAMHRNEKGD